MGAGVCLAQWHVPLAGAVPAGKDQGEWQSREPGRGRGDHREEQEQDHGHVGGPVLKEVR